MKKDIVGTLTVAITAAVGLAWKKIQSFSSSITIPEGAVIAFDRECKNIDGWTEYKRASGMTIIGSGEGADSVGYSKYFGHWQRSDGRYYNELTPNNLPHHTHSIPLSLDGLHYHSLDGTQSAGTTDGKHGRGQEPGFVKDNKEISTLENSSEVDSFTNIQPYVVLNYCIKEA